jgi:transketolase
LPSKWKSFGWDVLEVDGHDVGQLYDAFTAEKTSTAPTVIICNTVKGKGFSFSENNNDWHHAPLSKSKYEAAIEELKL